MPREGDIERAVARAELPAQALSPPKRRRMDDFMARFRRTKERPAVTLPEVQQSPVIPEPQPRPSDANESWQEKLNRYRQNGCTETIDTYCDKEILENFLYEKFGGRRDNQNTPWEVTRGVTASGNLLSYVACRKLTDDEKQYMKRQFREKYSLQHSAEDD